MTSFKIKKQDIHDMFYDIIKFMTYGVIVHVLLVSVDDVGELFNEKMLKVLLYTCISMIVYHLFIKKIVKQILG